MKNLKKAQISSTLSWFIATIVIFFIIVIFLVFSSIKNVTDTQKNIGAEVELVGTYAFLKQEQQRGLFVLFERGYENRTNYDLLSGMRKKIIRNNYLDQKDGYYAKFSNSLTFFSKEMKEKLGECFNFFIVDEKVSYTGDGFLGYSEGDTFYYFRFPKDSNLDKTDLLLASTVDLKRDFSFFFPEKSFALIKYIKKECPKEK